MIARLSELKYKMSKVSNLSKVKYLGFNKRYLGDTGQPQEATARKLPTVYRPASLFDDPEKYASDETL